MCAKLFRCTLNLRKHVLSHTREKPLFCKMCDKPFQTRSYLRRHKRIHTDEKPYSCSACEKSFRLRQNLKHHKKQHEMKSRTNYDVNEKLVKNHIIPQLTKTSQIVGQSPCLSFEDKLNLADNNYVDTISQSAQADCSLKPNVIGTTYGQPECIIPLMDINQVSSMSTGKSESSKLPKCHVKLYRCDTGTAPSKELIGIQSITETNVEVNAVPSR